MGSGTKMNLGIFHWKFTQGVSRRSCRLGIKVNLVWWQQALDVGSYYQPRLRLKTQPFWAHVHPFFVLVKREAAVIPVIIINKYLQAGPCA